MPIPSATMRMKNSVNWDELADHKTRQVFGCRTWQALILICSAVNDS